jgi:hypothetical protein
MRTSPVLTCTCPKFETIVSEAFKNCSCLVEVDKTLICGCEPVGGACHQRCLHVKTTHRARAMVSCARSV